ncbi:MAG: 4-hydroxy-tetrahydrodipicolinate synthase [Proteobacteria bacterium]|nr:4-hydroxy-tetrahydrodipicolinate synthase [Pseudomonadota bacterium]
MFYGSLVALVTPMQPDGAVDYATLSELVEWHIASKTDGLVILGTTGESPTIEPVERRQIIERVVTQVRQKIPVVVGTGTNCTKHTIQLTKQAMELGADGALIVTPYYNKPTQEGLYQHFAAVAEAVPLPQILYNVPSRTGCDLLPETILRLDHFTNIVGVKEATGDISRVEQLSSTEMDLLSGDDGTAAAFMLAGGKGVISVVANVAPRQIHELCQAALKKESQQVDEYDQQLSSLYKALSCEANPIPVKWALHEMGKIKSGIRLPLTFLSERCQPAVRSALQANGLTKGKTGT